MPLHQREAPVEECSTTTRVWEMIVEKRTETMVEIEGEEGPAP